MAGYAGRREACNNLLPHSQQVLLGHQAYTGVTPNRRLIKQPRMYLH